VEGGYGIVKGIREKKGLGWGSYIDGDFDTHVIVDGVLIDFGIPFFCSKVPYIPSEFKARMGIRTYDESVFGEVFEETAGLTAFYVEIERICWRQEGEEGG
jgi:hypothetical protein